MIRSVGCGFDLDPHELAVLPNCFDHGSLGHENFGKESPDEGKAKPGPLRQLVHRVDGSRCRVRRGERGAQRSREKTQRKAEKAMRREEEAKKQSAAKGEAGLKRERSYHELGAGYEESSRKKVPVRERERREKEYVA